MNKPYAEMTDAERGSIRYHELPEPDLRAFIIAHAIRKGQKPVTGATLGFALTISETEVEDPARITQEEIGRAKPLTEKVWLWFKVTEADHQAGIAMINSQRATHLHGNTIAPTDKEFLVRLVDALR